MIGKTGKLLWTIVVALATLEAGQALGQGLPPAPVPVAQTPPPLGNQGYPGGIGVQLQQFQQPPPPPPSGSLPPLTPPPGPAIYPPPPPPPPPQGVVFHDNRDQWVLDPRRAQAPGFFGLLELDLIGPRISGTLRGPTTIGGQTNFTELRSADLDWVGAPNIQLGYRFGENLGAFVASYRSVVSQGSETIPYDFGDGFLETRLNMNIVDLDYLSSKVNFAPLWDLDFRVGARIAAIYYDNQASGQFLSERTSNNFVGAGPHFGLEVSRQLDLIPGLSVFGRLDGSFVIGNQTQSFETVLTLNGGQTQFGGASRFSSSQTTPVLGFMTGLSYQTPGLHHWLRFDFGYLFEQWWDIGGNNNSTGDITLNGLFFRGAFNY